MKGISAKENTLLLESIDDAIYLSRSFIRKEIIKEADNKLEVIEMYEVRINDLLALKNVLKNL